MRRLPRSQNNCRWVIASCRVFLFAVGVLCIGSTCDGQSTVKPGVLIDSTLGSLVGDPIAVSVVGLQPGQTVKLVSRFIDRRGRHWSGESLFRASPEGTIDPAKQKPIKAAWSDIDPIGPFWALECKEREGLSVGQVANFERLTFEIVMDGEVLSSSIAVRWHRSKNVEEIVIKDGTIVGRMFAPPSTTPLPGIVIVPGSEGGIPVAMAERIASRGYATLALAYFGEDSLPENLELIPLEYVEAAIDWLKNHPRIDKRRIGLIGGSKGGELALLMGCRREDLSVIVAAVPGTYVFQSIGGEENAATSSWSEQNKALPFVPYADSDRFRRTGVLSHLYEDSLATTAALTRIPLEEITAKTLLISGSDDRIWPSRSMCTDAIKRLSDLGVGDNFQHLKLQNIGHSVLQPGYRPSRWSAENGGTRQGQARAQARAWIEVVDFLARHLSLNPLFKK